MPRSKAATKIRQLFKEQQRPLLHKDIAHYLPELQENQISSMMCYLVKSNFVSRVPVDNPTPKRRKQVWQYTAQM
jgi:hypothetical protein